MDADSPGQGGRLLVLLGLTGFAITQPILAVLGDEPTFFTFRDAGPTEIVLFSLLVALVPPLAMWSVGLVAGLIRAGAGWALHLATVALLVGLIVLQYGKQLGLTVPALQVTSAVSAGLVGAWLYGRFASVAAWARFTAILPAIAVVSFLFVSPTSAVVRPYSGSDGPDTAAASGTTPSVLVLLLDELPTQSLLDDSGDIDPVRYPNLAALAEESSWYRNYSSTAQGTLLAVPSILTGTEPRSDPAVASNYPDNLFTLLAPTHQMRVREAATALCPVDICEPIGGGGAPATTSVVRTLSAEAASIWGERITLGEPVTGALDDFEEEIEAAPDPGEPIGFDREGLLQRPVAHADFVETIEPVDRPTLWFLHLTLPHSPWRMYPDGQDYDPGWVYAPESYPNDARNESGEWIAATAEQRHLLQLQYTDGLVGQVVDALKASGEYDDTMLVVTADHGISFELDAPQRSPVDSNLEGLAYVPLLVKEPGREGPGTVDTSNALAYDLLPTIAATVGVPVPWETSGYPLGSTEQSNRTAEKEFYDFGSGFAPVFEGILHFDGSQTELEAANRWIGSIAADDDPIAGLLSRLGIDDQLGRSLDDLDVDSSATGSASVDNLVALRRPPAEAPPGFVTGVLNDPAASDDAIVLVEVNGAVVTGSPVQTKGDEDDRFLAMLPPSTLGEENEIRLALLDGDSITPLVIE